MARGSGAKAPFGDLSRAEIYVRSSPGARGWIKKIDSVFNPLRVRASGGGIAPAQEGAAGQAGLPPPKPAFAAGAAAADVAAYIPPSG